MAPLMAGGRRNSDGTRLLVRASSGLQVARSLGLSHPRGVLTSIPLLSLASVPIPLESQYLQPYSPLVVQVRQQLLQGHHVGGGVGDPLFYLGVSPNNLARQMRPRTRGSIKITSSQLLKPLQKAG